MPQNRFATETPEMPAAPCVSGFQLNEERVIANHMIASLNSFLSLYPKLSRESLGYSEEVFDKRRADLIVKSVLMGRNLNLPKEIDDVDGVKIKGCAQGVLYAFSHGGIGNRGNSLEGLNAYVYSHVNNLQYALLGAETFMDRSSSRKINVNIQGESSFVSGEWRYLSGFLVEVYGNKKDGIIISNIFAFPRRDTVEGSVILRK